MEVRANSRGDGGDGVPISSKRVLVELETEALNHVRAEGKADPNTPDRDGNRPLHVCAIWNNSKTAEVLLAHGADKALANNDGQTALDWGDSFDKIKELLS